MLKKSLLAMALLVAAIIPAKAQDVFVEGEGYLLTMTGCDTLLQTAELLAYWEENGPGALRAWMNEHGIKPNGRGEPICGNAAGPMVPVITHGEYSVIYNGEQIMVYLVEFYLPEIGVSLYTISPKPTDGWGDGA